MIAAALNLLQTSWLSTFGRSQFSVEKANTVSTSMPHFCDSFTTSFRARTPASWPTLAGHPCLSAHRELPSIIIATCLGIRDGSSSVGNSRISTASQQASALTPAQPTERHRLRFGIREGRQQTQQEAFTYFRWETDEDGTTKKLETSRGRQHGSGDREREVTPERKDETGKPGSINGICRHLRSILAVSSVPEAVPSWKKDRRTGDKAYEQGKTLPQTDLFFLLFFFFLPTFLDSAETARRVTLESPIAGHSPVPDRTAKHLIPGTRSQRARSVCICEWGKQREHFSRCVEKRGTDSTRNAHCCADWEDCSKMSVSFKSIQTWKPMWPGCNRSPSSQYRCF